MHKYINAKCKKTNMHLCKRVFHGNSSRIQNIKGTGEASPVRGGDWAGFKFGADRAAV
jgi:hypothetical protein